MKGHKIVEVFYICEITLGLFILLTKILKSGIEGIVSIICCYIGIRVYIKILKLLNN